MKKLIFILMLLPLYSIAQKSDTTYYESSEDQGSFLFSFTLTFSKIADKNTLSLGGCANIYLSKHWYIGLFGERLAIDQTKTIIIDTITYSGLKLDYGFIGPIVGYVFFPDKKLSIYTSLRYGFSSVSLSSDNSGKGDNFSATTKKVLSDNARVLVPNVDFIYNAFPSLRFCASVGYKYNLGISNVAYSNKNFNSPYISLSLLFGIFPE